jgi:pimeloyl-ACP methyl ester carboxylesterase
MPIRMHIPKPSLGRAAIMGALIALLLFHPAAQAQTGQKSFVPTRLGQMFVIQYAASGPKSARHRPILLIHQTSLSHLEYTPLAIELAKDRPVVAIDLPGYGASDPLPAPITIDQ